MICASARWKLPTQASADADIQWLFLITTQLVVSFASQPASVRRPLPQTQARTFCDDSALGTDNS
ncbi:predicted protein [Plenodomus lingam JN3]|uniref:Predicted protein n=1 Tax=Leptosphaeria maculans (strain JN3 / isolate v23.1.3 / race Av1-4-5-6-7-8) TaxID=985895 RepID=E4ZK62_LEPMJ|nr:predicted protein [Plenodomus lingam JN3]CBX91657.1 predicted protein [Plenodomus lingam JN3]